MEIFYSFSCLYSLMVCQANPFFFAIYFCSFFSLVANFDEVNQVYVFELKSHSWRWITHLQNHNIHSQVCRKRNDCGMLARLFGAEQWGKKAYGNRFAATVTEVACLKKISSNKLCCCRQNVSSAVVAYVFFLFQWPVTLPIACSWLWYGDMECDNIFDFLRERHRKKSSAFQIYVSHLAFFRKALGLMQSN